MAKEIKPLEKQVPAWHGIPKQPVLESLTSVLKEVLISNSKETRNEKRSDSNSG